MNPSPTLVRALGPMTATAVVVGSVIGSGIFRKPSAIAASLPDFGYIAMIWIIGGLLSLFGALAVAELAAMFPHTGGSYVYLKKGFGRLTGFLWGWVHFFIYRSAAIAALATVFTESLHDVFKQLRGLEPTDALLSFWALRGITLAAIALLALINMRGVRWGGGFQLFITFVKVGSLVAIIVFPFLMWDDWQKSPVPIPERKLAFSWSGFGTALLSVLWAYDGWMNLAPVAGEIDRPHRNIPFAFITGTIMLVLLYLGVNVAYQIVIPQAEIAMLGQTNVATVFSERLLGPIGTIVASAAIMISVFGALNGNLLVGPRLLFAMAEDRLAPRVLSKVHANYRTPNFAIGAMAGAAMLTVLASALVPTNKPVFDILTDFAMFGAIIFETLAVATIFVFRRTLPEADRPYRCLGYPWVPVLYMLIPAYVFVNMFYSQQYECMAGLGFIAIGAAVYGIFLRERPANRNER